MHAPFPIVHNRFKQLAHMISIISLSVLASCARSGPTLDAGAGLSCVDDSPRCVRLRISTLNAYKADEQRRWIKQPVSSRAYATGVRMFAYRDAQARLSCAELAHGRREAAGAATALRKPGAGLTPAQISRGLMLAGDVGDDLRREQRRRCR